MAAATRKSCSFKRTNTANAYGVWVEKRLYLFLAMVPAQVAFVAFAEKARHSMVAHLGAGAKEALARKRAWDLAPFHPDARSYSRPVNIDQVVSTQPDGGGRGGKMGCISRALPCEGRKRFHGVSRLARETLTAGWHLYVWCSPDTRNQSLLVFGERRHSTDCEASTGLQCASRESRGR
jgi:hypothetical protein